MNQSKAVILIQFALLIFSLPLWGQASAPEPLGAEVPPLLTGEEAAVKNMLTLGIRVADTYDDNELSNNTQRVGSFQYDIQPTVSFEQALKRLDWSFHYSPGFSINQRLANQRYFSQSGSADVAYELSSHLLMRVHGATTITTNPFDQLDRNSSSSQLSLQDRPNGAVVLPQVKQIGEEGSLDVDYELSEHTSIGATGSFSNMSFRNLQGDKTSNSRLIDTRIVHGRSYIAHKISRKQTIGANYDFQDLSFPKAHARTETHSFQLFDTFEFKPGMKLTIFGGPDYSRLHDQVEVNLFFFQITIPVFRTMWSESGGADFSWQTPRTALRSSFVRKVSDGGGLIGAVLLHSGDLEVRRELTRRWTGDIGGNYSDSNSLTAGVGLSTGTSHIRSYSASGGFTRRISENIDFGIHYQRLHQNQGSPSGLALVADHNRVYASIEYQWKHPIGR